VKTHDAARPGGFVNVAPAPLVRHVQQKRSQRTPGLGGIGWIAGFLGRKRGARIEVDCLEGAGAIFAAPLERMLAQDFGDVRRMLMDVAQIWFKGVLLPAAEEAIHGNTRYLGLAADESAGERIGEPDRLDEVGREALETHRVIVLSV